VLEHIKDYPFENLLSLLNPGGHMVLTFPFSDKYVENVYDLISSNAYGKRVPYICQSYSEENLKGLCIVDQEYWRFWSGRYWTTGRKLNPVQVKKTDSQLTCILVAV